MADDELIKDVIRVMNEHGNDAAIIALRAIEAEQAGALLSGSTRDFARRFGRSAGGVAKALKQLIDSGDIERTDGGYRFAAMPLKSRSKGAGESAKPCSKGARKDIPETPGAAQKGAQNELGAGTVQVPSTQQEKPETVHQPQPEDSRKASGSTNRTSRSNRIDEILALPADEPLDRATQNWAFNVFFKPTKAGENYPASHWLDDETEAKKAWFAHIRNAGDLQAFHGNLKLWRQSRRWQDGYIPDPANFLRKKIFRSPPPPAARGDAHGDRPRANLPGLGRRGRAPGTGEGS